MRNAPKAPPATSSRVRAIGGSKLWLGPTMSTTPAARAASITAPQSASVSAIGFSTRMCFPRDAASCACAAWNSCGVEM